MRDRVPVYGSGGFTSQLGDQLSGWVSGQRIPRVKIKIGESWGVDPARDLARMRQARAGVIASSIALVGFGLDSVIEFFAAAIVVWQLRGEDRETRAVRLIGVTFFALAAYLAVEGIRDLADRARPEQSIPGLAVTAAALIVMPLLAVAKRRTGRALGNRTLIADSAETAFCAFTSAATLLGVGLNAGARLVVGRSGGRPRYRCPGGQGGPGSLGRLRLTVRTLVGLLLSR